MRFSLVILFISTVSAFPFSSLSNWFCDLALEVFHDVAPSQLAQASTYCSSFIRPTVKAVSTTTSVSSVPGPTSTVATTTLVSTSTSTVVTTSTSTTTTGTSMSIVTSAIDLVSLRILVLIQGTSVTVVTVTQTTTSGTTYIKKRHEPTLVARAQAPGVWSKLADADKSAGCSCVLLDHLPSPTTSISTVVIPSTLTGSPTPVTATTLSVTTVHTTSTSVQMLSVEATSTSTTTISTYGATSTSTQTAFVSVPSDCPLNPLGPDFNSWSSYNPDYDSSVDLTPGEWTIQNPESNLYNVVPGGISITLDGFDDNAGVYLYYLGIEEVCAGQGFTITFDVSNTGSTSSIPLDQNGGYGAAAWCYTASGQMVEPLGGSVFYLAPGESTTMGFPVSAQTFAYTPSLIFDIYNNAFMGDTTLTFSNFQVTSS